MQSISLVGKWEVISQGDPAYLIATDRLNRREYIFTKSGLVKGFGLGNDWERCKQDSEGISVEYEGMWKKTLLRVVSDSEVHFSWTGLNSIQVLKRCKPELPNAAFIIIPPNIDSQQVQLLITNISAGRGIVEHEYEPELLEARRVFCLWLNGRLALIVCHNQPETISGICSHTARVFDKNWGNSDARMLTKRFYSLSPTPGSRPLLNEFTSDPSGSSPVTFEHVNGVPEILLVVKCDESIAAEELQDLMASTGLNVSPTQVELHQPIAGWLHSKSMKPSMIYAFAPPPEDILIAIAKVVCSLALFRMSSRCSVSLHLLWDFSNIPCRIRPGFI